MLPAHAIVGALCHDITTITAHQAARGWLISLDHARRLLRVLTEEGLLEADSVHAVPPGGLSDALIVWHPGEPAPRFGSLSHAARRRAGRETHRLTVYRATSCAARLFGGSPPEHCRFKATHDLLLTEVYLRHRQRSSAPWLRGDLYCSRMPRVPDAFLLRDRTIRDIDYAIEVLGCYSSRRIRGFHEFCESQDLKYQLW